MPKALYTAALCFWLLVLVRRISIPRGRALVGALLYGIRNFGACYAFVYWGLLSMPAGLAQVVIALVPLLTFFLALAHAMTGYSRKCGRATCCRGSILVSSGLSAAGTSVRDHPSDYARTEV
jgi:drug/metabolite transporter (DMT)-like permease